MANEIITQLILDLDSFRKSLKTIEGEAKEGGKKVSESLGTQISKAFKGDITDSISAFKSSLLGLAAVYAAIRTATAAIRISDESIKATAAFEAQTRRAGVASGELLAALEKSSAGLLDNTDLLKLGSSALVELGSSAKKLPELMETARKATKIFGGDIAENFDQITRAISSTSTRGLRSVGIFIDSEAAIKKYAKSIGVSSDALTQAGRQQAILNAVLEKGRTSLESAKDSSLRLGPSIQRFQVAFANLGEFLSGLFVRIIGPFFDKLLVKATGTLNSFTNLLTATFGHGAEKAAAQTARLTDELLKLTNRMDENQKLRFQLIPPGELTLIQMRVAAIKTELAGLKSVAGQEVKTPAEKAAEEVNTEAQAKKLAEFNKISLDANKERISAMSQLAITENDQQFIINDQRALIESDHQLRMAQIRRDFLDTGIVTQQQFNETQTALEATKNAKLQSLSTEASKALSTSFRQGVVNTIVSGVSAIATALIKGENVFGNFVKAVLGVLGDMALQMGAVLIGAGIGIEALKSLGGAAAIAAGIGLVALGSVLKAIAGGGGEAATADTGGGAGGGIASPGGLSTGLVEERREPNTSLVVNMQGNILDRKESGLAIAEIIQDTFGSNGINFGTA